MGISEIVILVLAVISTIAYFAAMIFGFKVVTKRLVWRDKVEKLLSGLTVTLYVALMLFIPFVLYLMYNAALT
jgi:hypothetical protein